VAKTTTTNFLGIDKRKPKMEGEENLISDYNIEKSKNIFEISEVTS